ncbi:nuclear factor 7, brain-like [Hyperolius riggenbachi]|uniref:nuclear factor 7, brain-like n=1 Tax=Hyperolius riggenbachi TaxID=752182 RepID=UPI0035A2FC86
MAAAARNPEEDDFNPDEEMEEEEIAVQIGATYLCRRQDGSYHDAEVLKSRMNKKAGREEFYVRYVGLTRQRPEWVDKSRLVLTEEEEDEANEEDPEAPEDGNTPQEWEDEDAEPEAKKKRIESEDFAHDLGESDGFAVDLEPEDFGESEGIAVDLDFGESEGIAVDLEPEDFGESEGIAVDLEPEDFGESEDFAEDLETENLEASGDIAEDLEAPTSNQSEDVAEDLKSQANNLLLISEDVAEDLICLLCKELFKDPVMVACGHNYCRDCMDNAWKDEDIFVCPDCNEMMIDKTYTANRALANLVKKAAGAVTMLSPAKPALKMNTEIFNDCPEHDERLKSFCKDDGTLSCIICRDSLKHAGHNFLSIRDAAELYMPKVSAIVTPLEEALEVVEPLPDQQNEKIEQLKADMQECEQHIMGGFEGLHNFLQEQEEKYMQKIRNEGKERLEEMQSSALKMQKNEEFLTHAIAEANEKLSETDAASFLSNIKSFLDQCERVQKEACSEKTIIDKEELKQNVTKVSSIQYTVWKEMKSLVAPDLDISELEDDDQSAGDTDAGEKRSKGTASAETGDKQIWIIGHALISQAEQRAHVASYGHDLCFGKENYTVHWMTKAGMRWHELTLFLKRKVDEMGAPTFLVIHLGGNDFGLVSAVNLMSSMRRVLADISHRYKDTVIFWSYMVPRSEWYFTAMEKCRKNTNRGIAKFAGEGGYKVIPHIGVETQFKNRCINKIIKGKSPGLSGFELDTFNMDIREAIKAYM